MKIQHPRKTIIAIIAASSLCLTLIAGNIHAREAANEPEAEKPVVQCPVMKGEPANMALSVATDEGPVFLCCAGCVKKFKKNADKYADAVAQQRKTLAAMPKVQVACPISGNAVDEKVTLEHNGDSVQFCCDDCRQKFKKDPAKYAGKLASSYTYQTMCPVMSEPINPGVFADLPTGDRVYLCCKGCIRKLVKNPKKYDEALAKQQYHVDWKKMEKGD